MDDRIINHEQQVVAAHRAGRDYERKLWERGEAMKHEHTRPDILTGVCITFLRESDAIERVTGPEGDEWRAHMYPGIKTRTDVLKHWAHNAFANGVTDVSELDGWADLEPGTVVLAVMD